MGQPPGYAPATSSILPDDRPLFSTLLVAEVVQEAHAALDLTDVRVGMFTITATSFSCAASTAT